LIRLMPDPSVVATNIRAHPDSMTDFTFVSGAAYTVSVDTSQGNPRELFDHRDYLLQEQFLLSGTAYVSGPGGLAYSPGAIPVANAVIHVDGLPDQMTGPDGSYKFVVPGPGVYQIST